MIEYYEDGYLDLLSRILKYGEKREDRTGTGTLSLFGETLKFHTKLEGFPLLTTKKMPFKSILSELIWFLEPSSDERRLAEILYGTRDKEKKTIWSPNAEYTSGSKFQPLFPGDLGNIYGKQWRRWSTTKIVSHEECIEHSDGSETLLQAKVKTHYIDQIRQVVDRIKSNPTDRRLIVSAWNPAELDNMALPPCHMMMQFYVRSGKFLDCQMYQRSVDTFLGLPFNMASYSILMYIIANEVGLVPGVLTMCLGDTHLYSNAIEAAKMQLTRNCRPSPILEIDSKVGVDNLSMDYFKLHNYQSDLPIRVKMAA